MAGTSPQLAASLLPSTPTTKRFKGTPREVFSRVLPRHVLDTDTRANFTAISYVMSNVTAPAGNSYGHDNILWLSARSTKSASAWKLRFEENMLLVIFKS